MISDLHGGHVIRVIRNMRGMTQEEVSDLYGVSLRTLKGWEAGRSEPRLSDVHGICETVCRVSLLQALVIATAKVETA